MNVIYTRMLSLASFVLLCVTLTFWAITLTQRQPASAAALQPTSISVVQAEALFGAPLAHSANQDIHLSGILSFIGSAAVVVSNGSESSRTVSIGSEITQGAKLHEVRARSIVIDRNGSYSEVFLPSRTPSPAVYVR